MVIPNVPQPYSMPKAKGVLLGQEIVLRKIYSNWIKKFYGRRELTESNEKDSFPGGSLQDVYDRSLWRSQLRYKQIRYWVTSWERLRQRKFSHWIHWFDLKNQSLKQFHFFQKSNFSKHELKMTMPTNAQNTKPVRIGFIKLYIVANDICLDWMHWTKMNWLQ